MASHHHCHQSQPQPSCHHCSCCCSSTSPSPYHPSSSSFSSFSAPSQPQPSISDALVQAIATQLLQSSQTHLHTHFLKPHHQQQHNHQRFHQEQQQQQTQLLFSSLLHRIDALEASLSRVSVVPSPCPSPSHDSSFPPTTSLRDLAARTIQTHFRAFLVRRSRAFRYLKELAVIKSNLNALKSSLSGKAHFKYHALSQKAMELLHQLDSIQAADPMIREGKRSISRELVRFLEFVDRVSVRRRAETVPSKPIKKNVSFVEPIKKSRVFVRTHEPFSSGDVLDIADDDQRAFLADDQIELMESICKQVEDTEEMSRRISEVDEEEQAVNEGSPQLSIGEGNPGKIVKNRVNCETSGYFAFSAPLPVQMEPKGR